MELQNINELKEKLSTKDKLTVVDFYATWCGPCKMLAPVIEELSQEITDVNFIKVNIDNFNELATQFNVMSIPTIVFIKNESEIQRVVGFKSKDELTTIINQIK